MKKFFILLSIGFGLISASFADSATNPVLAACKNPLGYQQCIERCPSDGWRHTLCLNECKQNYCVKG